MRGIKQDCALVGDKRARGIAEAVVGVAEVMEKVRAEVMCVHEGFVGLFCLGEFALVVELVRVIEAGWNFSECSARGAKQHQRAARNEPAGDLENPGMPKAKHEARSVQSSGLHRGLPFD